MKYIRGAIDDLVSCLVPGESSKSKQVWHSVFCLSRLMETSKALNNHPRELVDGGHQNRSTRCCGTRRIEDRQRKRIDQSTFRGDHPGIVAASFNPFGPGAALPLPSLLFVVLGPHFVLCFLLSIVT